jgi:hypothetical protein
MSLENIEPGQDAQAGAVPPGNEWNPNGGELVQGEIDIGAYAERGHEVPHARCYVVRIDCETVRVTTAHPTGEALLAKVDKRPCAFELIEEFVHCENNVVESGETVDLRKRGLKGFITAHKEIVTVFINGDPYPIERGERTVAQILTKVGESPEGYILLEEKDGPPLPLPVGTPVKICGCETFHSQVQTGGSS